MKKKFTVSGLAFLLFLVLILLLKTVDVAPVGAGDTEMGLSSFNRSVLFDYNGIFTFISDVFVLIAFFSPVVFAYMGITQWINRKSLTKIDKEIYCIAILYVVMAVIYLFFENVIVNYRPIIMPNAAEAEASFPSSHTMFALTLMGSSICMAKRYIKNKAKRNVTVWLCVIVATLVAVFRLMSGAHWFTDILGGILISTALTYCFDGAMELYCKK